MTGADGFPAEMAPSDTILWRIERDPVLRSTITAVTLLDREPDLRRLRRRVLGAYETVPRMHQVVSDRPIALAPPRWVDAKHFDLDYHLSDLALGGSTRLPDVLDFAARQAAAGFDRSKPLWEFTVVHDVVLGPGARGAALVQKFHHSVADGLGAVQIAMELLETSRAASNARRRFTSALQGGDDPAHETAAGAQSALRHAFDEGRHVIDLE